MPDAEALSGGDSARVAPRSRFAAFCLGGVRLRPVSVAAGFGFVVVRSESVVTAALVKPTPTATPVR